MQAQLLNPKILKEVYARKESIKIYSHKIEGFKSRFKRNQTGGFQNWFLSSPFCVKSQVRHAALSKVKNALRKN